jgi:secondary thiamine-phosphate synthase enzyme
MGAAGCPALVLLKPNAGRDQGENHPSPGRYKPVCRGQGLLRRQNVLKEGRNPRPEPAEDNRGKTFFTNDEELQMKSYRKELWFEVPTRRAFINITGEVNRCLQESGIQEGLLLVNAMHITASVFINDDEPGLHHDYEVWLEKLAPHEPVSGYRHNVGEDNADAHMKRQVMGREVVVAVTEGRMDFGTWERIFYGEFDGRRRKRVLVKIIGE